MFVVFTTSGTYSDKIILFIMWLFDARREFFIQEYIPEFGAMNHEDFLGFQRLEEDENVTNRRTISLINERTVIRNIMRQLVDAIQT